MDLEGARRAGAGVSRLVWYGLKPSGGVMQSVISPCILNQSSARACMLQPPDGGQAAIPSMQIVAGLQVCIGRSSIAISEPG